MSGVEGGTPCPIFTLGAVTYDLTYDAAGRVDLIALRDSNPLLSNDYGYDNLDRLTSAVFSVTTLSYGYDAVGNRLSRTLGGFSETYSYPTDKKGTHPFFG